MRARIPFLALSALATLTVLRPSQALSADRGKASENSCSALIVSADRSEDLATTKTKVFRATRILDVRVRAVTPANVEFESDDVVVFRFTTPRGGLYREVEVPVRPSRAGAEKERRRPGYPFPLEVQEPQSFKLNGQPAKSVEARLPVGGTAIMESGLYGVWRVEALVGDARPCSATFELKP